MRVTKYLYYIVVDDAVFAPPVTSKLLQHLPEEVSVLPHPLRYMYMNLNSSVHIAHKQRHTFLSMLYACLG